MTKRHREEDESVDTTPTTALQATSRTTRLDTSSKPTGKRQKVVANDFLPVDPAVLPDDVRLDLVDSEIYYVADFIDASTAKRWYKDLALLSEWYQPTLKMYGRSFLQSREIIAYGDNKAADDIAYSGTKVPLMKTHPEILLEIQAFVEQKLNTKFNHCMLNHYKDGSVHIGAHSDNLENLCIASISLGAARDFILTHKKRPSTDEAGRSRKRFSLADGSLVIMQGSTQRYWKHEIPKQPKIKQGRISLTFRQLVDK